MILSQFEVRRLVDALDGVEAMAGLRARLASAEFVSAGVSGDALERLSRFEAITTPGAMSKSMLSGEFHEKLPSDDRDFEFDVEDRSATDFLGNVWSLNEDDEPIDLDGEVVPLWYGRKHVLSWDVLKKVIKAVRDYADGRSVAFEDGVRDAA